MQATQDVFEEAEQRLQQIGRWIVGGIETRTFWPTRPQLINFEGREFLLQPARTEENQNSLPAIAIRANSYDLTDTQARAAIMRLATAIAWRDKQKVEIVMWGGGNRPYRMGIAQANSITRFFSNENLHMPQSDEAKKAMAYYREGMALDNPFYAFLGYYKASSRSLPNGKQRGPWIQAALDRLIDARAIQRRDELREATIDISTYVSEQGRHAIAHAERIDIIDPDAPEDHHRISKDLPLMRHLAELAMEERLGIPSPDAFVREHLYELEGFRALFTPAALAALQRGELDPDEQYEGPSHYFVLARRQGQHHSLGRMTLQYGGLEDRMLVLELTSEHGRVGLRVRLDFVNERLLFDPLGELGLRNGNRQSRRDIEEELALCAFRWCMACTHRLPQGSDECGSLPD